MFVLTFPAQARKTDLITDALVDKFNSSSMEYNKKVDDVTVKIMDKWVYSDNTIIKLNLYKVAYEFSSTGLSKADFKTKYLQGLGSVYYKSVCVYSDKMKEKFNVITSVSKVKIIRMYDFTDGVSISIDVSCNNS